MRPQFEMRALVWIFLIIYTFGAVILGAATFGAMIYAAWEHSR